MKEPTEAEKIAITQRRFDALSARAMELLDDGNNRPHLVTVDEELERVLRKIGVAQFRGLSIYRRADGVAIRESHTHPAERRLKLQLRSAERRLADLRERLRMELDQDEPDQERAAQLEEEIDRAAIPQVGVDNVLLG